MNLCQPDEKKSCSACCGLFNHSDISRENLTRFLKDGEFRTENYWRYEIEGSYPEQTTSCRDYSSHICPFNSFISRGKPGCRIHPLYAGEEHREMALYGAAACKNYSCPAYILFNDDEKKIIIDSINDWYLYTIAIIDPLSTIWILDQICKAGFKNKSPEYENILNASLEIHSAALAQYKDTVFCYSMDEYKNERENFSLNEDNNGMQKEQYQILQVIENQQRI